jgi:hypothetical protein
MPHRVEASATQVHALNPFSADISRTSRSAGSGLAKTSSSESVTCLPFSCILKLLTFPDVTTITTAWHFARSTYADMQDARA